MDEADRAEWRAIEGGGREPSWDLLSRRLTGSSWLTEEGVLVARWAMEAIAAFLGEAWLRRSFRTGSPLMDWVWSPLNDVPHVHLRRMELGARLDLLKESAGRRELRNLARNRVAQWVPVLLQLEVGGLAHHQGWRVEFEPVLPSRRRGDLLLTGPTTMLVETTSVGPPRGMRETSRFSDRAMWRLQMIAADHGLAAAGNLVQVVPDAELEAWLGDVERQASEIAGSGGRRTIPSPGGGKIVLIDGPVPEDERIALSGPTVTGDEWARIASRIRGKARQTAGQGPVWLRIDVGLSLWGLTTAASWPRPDMHAALAAHIASAIQQLPHVAGVVISGPTSFGAPGGAPGSWDLVGDRAFGLIRHLRQNLYREAVFVAGAHRLAFPQLAEWKRWYLDESSWLDWALGRLGHPRTQDLFVPHPP